MSAIQIYIFNSQQGFNTSGVDISTSAKLSLVPSLSQLVADFNSSAGFSFDAQRAEFISGSIRKKDQRPTSSVIGATFTSSANLNWSSGAGSLGAIVSGGSVSGGKLVLTGSGNSFAKYNNSDIGAISSQGAIKFKITPNYSGSPASNLGIFSLSNGVNSNNKIALIHAAAGTLRFIANDSAGTAVYNQVFFGSLWAPVIGTTYEFELNWNSVTGEVRLFIDGLLKGQLEVIPYTRQVGASVLEIGAFPSFPNSNESFDDIVIFSLAQHTAPYSPGYSLPEFSYLSSLATSPPINYSGVGNVLSINSFSSVETGTPRFLINGMFWNGLSWSLSNGTYTEASSSSVVNLNIGTLPVSGNSVALSVVFSDGNSQSSVDNVSIGITGQSFGSFGYIDTLAPIDVKILTLVENTLIQPIGTSVKMIIKDDNVFKYWDGLSWVVSDGSAAQSNTEQEINSKIQLLDLAGNSSIGIRWILTTSIGTQTPQLIMSGVHFEFGALAQQPNTCLVYGYLRDISGKPIEGAELSFSLLSPSGSYSETTGSIVATIPVLAVSDSFGYFDIRLIKSSFIVPGFVYSLVISINGVSIKKTQSGPIAFTVPDSGSQDITNLI